jgi:hypothetical protein
MRWNSISSSSRLCSPPSLVKSNTKALRVKRS